MAQSLRKRIIEEWRGLPEPEEKPDRTLSIREVLVQLAPKLGLEVPVARGRNHLGLGGSRRRLFCQAFPPGATPSRALVVNVLQPTVMYELDRQWKSLILTKLKKRFGSKLIKELRFRVG